MHLHNSAYFATKEAVWRGALYRHKIMLFCAELQAVQIPNCAPSTCVFLRFIHSKAMQSGCRYVDVLYTVEQPAVERLLCVCECRRRGSLLIMWYCEPRCWFLQPSRINSPCVLFYISLQAREIERDMQIPWALLRILNDHRSSRRWLARERERMEWAGKVLRNAKEFQDSEVDGYFRTG